MRYLTEEALDIVLSDTSRSLKRISLRLRESETRKLLLNKAKMVDEVSVKSYAEKLSFINSYYPHKIIEALSIQSNQLK